MSGGTLTGKITLDGAPTADLHAATKKYVDDTRYDDSGLSTVIDSLAGTDNELKADLTKLHTYIAEHVTDVSEATLDPSVADAPAHYYLTAKARHTVRGQSVPFESGLYELTTGTANAFTFVGARVGTGASRIYGMVSKNAEGVANQGSISHNPLSAIAAMWSWQDSGDSNHYLGCLIKHTVYEVLRQQHNLSNTFLYFTFTDGTTAQTFEMGYFANRVIDGIQYAFMRSHLIDVTTQNKFYNYFTSANSFAPTLTVTFTQGTDRSYSPLDYSGVNTSNNKAYTFRDSGFAVITGLGDDAVKSDQIDDKVVLTQAAYNALASKDARTEYVIVG